MDKEKIERENYTLSPAEFQIARQKIIDILTATEAHKGEAADLCASALNTMAVNGEIGLLFRIEAVRQVKW